MVKLNEPSEGKRLPQWHSSHQFVSDSLEALHHNALQQTINFRFRPKAISEYGDSTDVVSATYYIPRSKNQVGFDSFIHADDGFLYIFQITISSDHDVNPKMEQYLKRISPMISKWRFVFVTTSQSTLISLQSRGQRGLGYSRRYCHYCNPTELMFNSKGWTDFIRDAGPNQVWGFDLYCFSKVVRDVSNDYLVFWCQWECNARFFISNIRYECNAREIVRQCVCVKLELLIPRH